MKYCGKCGAQLDDGADVCVKCKAPCDNDVFAKEPDKKDGSRMGLIAVVLLILVLIAVGCYYFAEISFYNSLLDF